MSQHVTEWEASCNFCEATFVLPGATPSGDAQRDAVAALLVAHVKREHPDLIRNQRDGSS